jgi:glycosyltransferase involved in cell wall biosynthesis
MKSNPDLSIVIPFYNEYESLPELHDWIKSVMRKQNISYEIVFVDDGSTDQSWKAVERLLSSQPNIKAIRFRRNHGKSAALHVGFREASGQVVITMDADLQDSPDEIPALYKMIKFEGYDLVSGWKKKRFDPLGKTIPSKLFNYTARIVSGIKIHDFNCGLKAYKSKVIKNIEIYGEMHRYIPIIAKEAGFNLIAEKIVEHHARKYGVSKFGIERMMKGFLDLLSLKFITKFSKRPMHLFGGLGSMMFFVGGVATTYILIDKLYKQFSDLPARAVTDQPAFFLALLFIVMGVQLFLAGFLGELVSRNSTSRNEYHLDVIKSSHPDSRSGFQQNQAARSGPGNRSQHDRPENRNRPQGGENPQQNRNENQAKAANPVKTDTPVTENKNQAPQTNQPKAANPVKTENTGAENKNLASNQPRAPHQAKTEKPMVEAKSPNLVSTDTPEITEIKKKPKRNYRKPRRKPEGPAENTSSEQA